MALHGPPRCHQHQHAIAPCSHPRFARSTILGDDTNVNRTTTVVLLAVLAQAAGNVFLTRGMKATAAIRPEAAGVMSWVEAAGTAAAQPDIWIGTILLITFFALCSAALSWADLSYVIPATAIGYVLNVAAGQFLLHETVPPSRWIGSLVVTAGVICVSRSARTPASAQAPASEPRA